MPMLPRRFYTSDHFDVIKRLRQNVPGTQVYSLGPKAVISKPGCDDQGWRMWHSPETLQQVNPGSPLYVHLTQNNGDVVILEQGQCRETIITAEQLPLRVSEDRFQGQVILSKRADGKDRQGRPGGIACDSWLLAHKKDPSFAIHSDTNGHTRSEE